MTNSPLPSTLLSRLREATEGSWELERAIKAMLEGRVYVSYADDLANRNGATPPHYTTSLDAALRLVELVLPGSPVALTIYPTEAHASVGVDHTGLAPTAPLALLIALLTALGHPQ